MLKADKNGNYPITRAYTDKFNKATLKAIERTIELLKAKQCQADQTTVNQG